jgi:Flp pilus assembly pilin Flp
VFYYRVTGFAGRLRSLPEALGKRSMLRISSDTGQTTAEYGLIFALVLVAAVVTVITVGDAVERLWMSFITAWPA